MSTLFVIIFWVVVFMVWRDAQIPKKEIPEERIEAQLDLIAKLEDRALGKHPNAYVHEALADERKALSKMYEMNLKWHEMQLEKGNE